MLLCAWCALRIGEALELRRKDIDLERAVVRVRRAVSVVHVIESSEPSALARKAGVAAYLDYLIDHRAVIGFLTRDLSLLTHPTVVTRGARLQERFEAPLMGP